MAELSLDQAQRVHLVGIGGSGMGALASLLLLMGKHISGSELAPGAAVEALRAAGAVVYPDHAAEHVGQADYVVRSSAVPALTTPRWRRPLRLRVAEQEARRGGTGELMRDRSGVAIAGTHGKTTTTTSLVTWLLDRGGLDPSALIGADTPAFPTRRPAWRTAPWLSKLTSTTAAS